jgi:predicted methyltransferase
MKFPLTLLIIFALVGCKSIFRPYPCGPVLDMDGIQVFKKQNEYLGLKPGMVFADIGASSGYYEGAMAVFLDSVTFYLNDIDHHCLNERNVTKVLRYYSKLKGKPIESTNPFHIVLGTPTNTNLPDNKFDVIFTNATMHVIDYPDSILSDLHRNLKPGGLFFVRDEFVATGELKKCGSKKCGHFLLQRESFLDLMAKNGFRLSGESHEFGHPIFKFSK